MLTLSARLLGDADRVEVDRVLDGEPIAAAQVAERIATGGLAWWRIGARVFGYRRRGRLEALCWMGANLVPVHAGPAAAAAFAELAAGEARQCSSMVGPADAVLRMWSAVRGVWGPARDVRADQPVLMTEEPAAVAADPAVRLVRPHEFDALFPAAVAMYTEEVGVSPLVEAGGQAYRDRIAELIRSRRAFARIEHGEVVFKAELAVITRHTAQIQGVWVAPGWRGRGLASAGVAAVTREALRHVAPSVSLYVNAHNLAARRVYARCGFRQVGTFATILF